MKSNKNRLTKKVIRDAYHCGIIHLSKDKLGGCIVANIGKDYFCFDDLKGLTVDEYKNTFSEEMIVEKMFDELKIYRRYDKYTKRSYEYFREYLFKTMYTKSNTRSMNCEECVAFINSHSAKEVVVIDMYSKNGFEKFLDDIDRAREREYYNVPINMFGLSNLITEMKQIADEGNSNGKVWYYDYPAFGSVMPYNSDSLHEFIIKNFNIHS